MTAIWLASLALMGFHGTSFHAGSRIHASRAKAAARKRQIGPANGWAGYGGSFTHEAEWVGGSQALKQAIWNAPLDAQPSYYGGVVFMHYASPCFTPQNTAVYAYRYNTSANGVTSRDNWEVVGRSGATGSLKYVLGTDYSAPDVFTSGDDFIWTSVFPMGLAAGSQLVYAAAGGTILVRNADTPSAVSARRCFYASLATYNQNPSAYANIKICTPITGTPQGDAYFGYETTGTLPAAAASLGTGGLVHMGPNGNFDYIPVSKLGVDSALARPALNAGPALSLDQHSVYFSVCDPSETDAYLVKLDAVTLAPSASVKLNDPSVGMGAETPSESSAAPMVGPDGHVFYGVLRYNDQSSHGWMLQFDANLNPNNANGKKWPTGAFGWDDTPSIVPASIVPSYKGAATYLILSKYNNYVGIPGNDPGDGVNKVAVLDPTSDSTSTDRITGIPVMNEVLTVAGITPDTENRSAAFPNAVREWCINSAVVDVANKSAIINSEDGTVYRWSFISNSLTDRVRLQPPTSEAYTCTCIGPDGKIYAINNTILYALGAAKP